MTAKYFNAMETLTYGPGHVIYLAGDLSERFYLLKKGTVEYRIDNSVEGMVSMGFM